MLGLPSRPQVGQGRSLHRHRSWRLTTEKPSGGGVVPVSAVARGVGQGFRFFIRTRSVCLLVKRLDFFCWGNCSALSCNVTPRTLLNFLLLRKTLTREHTPGRGVFFR